MAYTITSDCTGCGDCLPACPNDAILFGTPLHEINTWLCTECVGFAHEPQCVSVCEAGAILLAPDCFEVAAHSDNRMKASPG